MEFKFTLGVDMSKEWFNYCLMSKNFEIICEGEVENNPESIFQFISHLLEKQNLNCIDEIVIIMEHTGIYVQHLVNCWLSKAGQLSIVPAYKVSQLLAGQLGWDEKSDQIDARRLSEYGFRYSDQLQLWKVKDQSIQLLNALNSTRRRLLNALNTLQVPLKESLRFDTVEVFEAIQLSCQQSIDALKADLKQTEQKIKELIMKDEHLKKLFDLITSIDGVGPVTASEVIIATEGFDKFKPDQAKAFARYAGVVPLKKQSGKSKKRSRTSKRANRKIKTVLTMGATSLIGSKSELGQYYDRKRAEGKPHLSVVNAIRNKLVLRIFAVVRNQVMYDKNLNVT